MRESYAAAAVASRGAGHAKENERSALAWDEELRDKEKQLCDRSLLSHAALILELCIVSVLLIAAT